MNEQDLGVEVVRSLTPCTLYINVNSNIYMEVLVGIVSFNKVWPVLVS